MPFFFFRRFFRLLLFAYTCYLNGASSKRSKKQNHKAVRELKNGNGTMTRTGRRVLLFRRVSFVAAFQDAETRQKLDLTVGLTTSSRAGPFFLSSSVSIGPATFGKRAAWNLNGHLREKEEHNKTVISYRFQLISASARRCNLQLYKVRRLPRRVTLIRDVYIYIISGEYHCNFVLSVIRLSTAVPSKIWVEEDLVIKWCDNSHYYAFTFLGDKWRLPFRILLVEWVYYTVQTRNAKPRLHRNCLKILAWRRLAILAILARCVPIRNIM